MRVKEEYATLSWKSAADVVFVGKNTEKKKWKKKRNKGGKTTARYTDFKRVWASTSAVVCAPASCSLFAVVAVVVVVFIITVVLFLVGTAEFRVSNHTHTHTHTM